MTRYISLGAILVLSTACLEKIDDTGVTNELPTDDPITEDTSSTEDTSTTDPEPEPLEAFISWDSDGATLNVFNVGPDDFLLFGMAQSNNGAYTSPEEAYSGNQWGAEDCTGLYQAFYDDDLCHEVPGADASGFAAIEFTSVASPSDVTTTGDEQFTLFADPAPFADTYVLDVNSEACYVWGITPAYYDGWAELYEYDCEYMPEWN